MRNSKVAIRYAKSLIQLALEKNVLDETFEDMQLVSKTIADNRDLALMLKSPIIHSEEKVKVLEAVFAGKVGELASKFIQLIVKQGRETVMQDIVSAYVDQVKIHKNIIQAQVTTATALDDANRAKVIEIINTSHSGTVELEEKVDPKLIGGYILKVGDQMIDASVASNLRRLKREFVGTSHVKSLN